MFVDLHIHSQYSDGTLSPEEIIEKSKAQDISLISICDHNLIDAYNELEVLCTANDIKFINGVEIHAVMDDMEYHILAYDFDMQNKELSKLLKYNRNVLLNYGKKVITKTSENYPNISVEELSKYERNRKNGGWESLDYLKSKNIIEGLPDYLNLLREYKLPFDTDFLSPEEVIGIIHAAGGYAVLAHLGDTLGQNLEVCEDNAVKFLSMGIDGFECYYPSHTEEITEFLAQLCREHDLMITAGSDEHGGFNNFEGGSKFYIGAVKIKAEQLDLKRLIDRVK